MPDICRIHRGAAVLLLTLAGGCGLLRPGGEETYFNTQALSTNRLLVAMHESGTTSGDLNLMTIDVLSGNTRRLYAAGSLPFASPAITKNASGQWLVAFGTTGLTVANAITGVREHVAGIGQFQMAAAFDQSTPGRLAYMDGSFDGGFDILVQNATTGSPTSVTGGASGDTTYWTPAWSADGEWILFAKVWGDTGAEAELWQVQPNGTGAEKLGITTTELPTYAVYSPFGGQVFVPGDFTSYYLSDGTAGTFDSLRTNVKLLSDLDAMGLEFVGSALSGPVHPGDVTTSARHTFPVSAQWTTQSNRLYFDALVARTFGSPPHEVAGVVVFSWIPNSQILLRHSDPIPLPEQDTMGGAISLVHPVIVP